jgi:hypothetical protein
VFYPSSNASNRSTLSTTSQATPAQSNVNGVLKYGGVTVSSRRAELRYKASWTRCGLTNVDLPLTHMHLLIFSALTPQRCFQCCPTGLLRQTTSFRHWSRLDGHPVSKPGTSYKLSNAMRSRLDRTGCRPIALPQDGSQQSCISGAISICVPYYLQHSLAISAALSPEQSMCSQYVWERSLWEESLY